MDPKVLIKTSYGEVSLETLVKVYETSRKHSQKRDDWFKTDEGRAYQRQKAKAYYERNKEKVLAKRAEAYQDDEKRQAMLDRAHAKYAKKKAEQSTEIICIE